MDPALETKLRELIDRQEIWAVMVRYARGVDRLNREMVRSCYHPDAIEDHHNFVGGVEDFIDWAFNYHSTLNTVCHHGVNNHSCELDGDDAHAETYYTFIGAHHEAPHMLSIGRYIDHFQRRNGEWKIANRVCVIEKSFFLAEGDPRSTQSDEALYGRLRPATRDRGDVSYQRPVDPRPIPAKA